MSEVAARSDDLTKPIPKLLLTIGVVRDENGEIGVNTIETVGDDPEGEDPILLRLDAWKTLQLYCEEQLSPGRAITED